MSDFARKKEAAIALLKSRGVKPSNYAPPLVRVLWALGVEMRLPHFAGFWKTAAWMGGFFGLGWGAVMWLLFWESKGIPLAGAAAMAVVAGAAFGLAMAAYYAHSRKKLALPSWESLGDADR